LKTEDFKRSVIYLSEHIHHSVDKAIRIAGLKECPRRYISLDENYKIRADELEQVIRTDKASGLLPWLIIASAGTTDVGAIDPLDELGNIAKKFNCWFHVDAAYGGFFILTDRGKNKLIGLDKSDSVVMDPHKGLFLPYGTGAVLVKDKHNLYESHYYNANYMQDASLNNEELAPADLSPELSKHFRGLRLWFPLKLAGVSAFKNALEEKLLLAQYFYEQLKEIKGFEVGPYPDLSVVTYRYIPKTGNADEFNKKLIREIQEEGKVFISSTILNGKFTLRAAILSFRTHLDTVDLLADILKHKVKGF
jgi:glutamate/tyrosine decarboxylase-like PLP-dependent enzyme